MLGDNENMIKAYDNNLDTSWVVNAAGNYTLDIEFPSNKEFDCIDFNEKSQGEYIYTNDQGVSEPTGVQTYGIINYNVQISSDGTSWQTIYVQDEMGLRKAVLPQTYSAKYMRLNITTDMPAAINEVSVGNIGKYDKKMRVVSYLNKHEDISGYEGNIKALTDIILINYGLWNSKGEFEFIETDSDNGTLTKTKLKSRIEEIKKINSKINIWFSFSKFTLAENEEKTELFTATTNKAALINTCLQLCEEYGFYGIDFDFEFPAGQAQTKGYNEFLVDLGKTLHSNGYKLSVATSNYVDHKLSAPYIDYVNLMTYDGVKFDRFGRHNTYNAIVRQINRMESNGFSRDQIVLGLGYYGRVNGGSAQMSYKSLAYRYYDAVISGMNVYDSEYYCAGTSANADKVILALDNNLCGVFSWTMATDLPITNEFSLARSVDRTIERFSSKY